MFGPFYFLGGLLAVVGAFVLMGTGKRKTSMVWALILPVSVFLGAGIFVSIGYLFAYLGSDSNEPKQTATNVHNTNAVTYHPDGSYTVYPAVGVPGTTMPQNSSGPTGAQMAFKVVGTAISAIAVVFGLLIIGVILMFLLSSGSSSSSGSKSY